METPSNPALDIIDLEWLGKLAEKNKLILIVDNCFATPYLQTPAKWGAHIVTHSATKFMDGQGRVMGGAIVGKKELIKEIRFFARHTGPSMSPFNAWVLSKILETLAVRMERHCQNALTIAEHFEKHQDVSKVKYPFLASHPQHALAKKQMRHGGGIVSFEHKGGIDGGRKFLNALKMIFGLLVRTGGKMEMQSALEGETDHRELPRLVFPTIRNKFGTLRRLMDRINECELAS